MSHPSKGRILPVVQEVGRLSGLAHPWAHLPWITLSTVAVAWLFEILPQAQEMFQYEKIAINGGEYWRIFTGHLTHWNGEHFLWDVIVFLALGAICERYDRMRFLAFLGLSSILITLAVWVGLPDMKLYRGLSGIDAGLYSMALLAFLCGRGKEGSVLRSHIAALFMLAFFAKVGYEIVTEDTVFVQNTQNFVPVPLAHLAGAVAGAATMLLFSQMKRMGSAKSFTEEIVQSHG